MRSGADVEGLSTMEGVDIGAFDLHGLRERLRKMSDEELRRFGREAKACAPPTAITGKSETDQLSTIHYQEALSEWFRRHPRTTQM
jgi:hypothetical protein